MKRRDAFKVIALVPVAASMVGVGSLTGRVGGTTVAEWSIWFTECIINYSCFKVGDRIEAFSKGVGFAFKVLAVNKNSLTVEPIK